MIAEELEEETRFGTSLTVCAVYLVYSGCELDELEWEDVMPGDFRSGTCTFYFENTPSLQEEFARFASGQARVEPQQFSTTFGQITRRMRNARDELEGRGGSRRPRF